MMTSSSSNSSVHAYWKRRPVSKPCHHSVQNSACQESFDEDISAIPPIIDLHRQWVNTYGRKFFEVRCYDVDEIILTAHDAVQILCKDFNKPRRLSIHCQRDKVVNDISYSDELSGDDQSSNDDTGDIEPHTVVLMRSDGFACRFHLHPGKLPPDPLCKLLADPAVVIIGFDLLRLHYHYAGTVGLFFTEKQNNRHDLSPIVEAIRSTNSAFFGTVLLQKEIDWIGKMILERAGFQRKFSPYTDDKRAALTFDLHELFEKRWSWVQKVLQVYNDRYHNTFTGWNVQSSTVQPVTDNTDVECPNEVARKGDGSHRMKKKVGLLGDHQGTSRQANFQPFVLMPRRRHPLLPNPPGYLHDWSNSTGCHHMQVGPRPSMVPWSTVESKKCTCFWAGGK